MPPERIYVLIDPDAPEAMDLDHYAVDHQERRAIEQERVNTLCESCETRSDPVYSIVEDPFTVGLCIDCIEDASMYDGWVPA